MFLYEYMFLKALVTTIIMETICILLCYQTKYFKKDKISYKKVFIIGIIASLATLPYLRFILPIFIPWYTERILIGEIGIVIMESIMLSEFLNINWRKALILSSIANLGSFIVGKIIGF